MPRMMKQYKTISEYIAPEPKEVRAQLQLIRKTIQKAAPQCVEAIRYGMPTFRLLEKNLIHFAIFNTHYGLYPGSEAIVIFRKELAKYDCSKGTIRLPLDKKVPLSLISKIVKFRIKSVLSKIKK